MANKINKYTAALEDYQWVARRSVAELKRDALFQYIAKHKVPFSDGQTEREALAEYQWTARRKVSELVNDALAEYIEREGIPMPESDLERVVNAVNTHAPAK